MSDELLIPQVPEPKPEDPEDVSWALSTAEAMWARGDHSEGVKWVRRAAEAASDAEQDMRSLELAKAAADLASMLTKRGQSRASIHIDDEELMDDTPPAPPPPKPIAKPAPPKAASIPPPRNAAGAPSVTKQVATPSRPPAPLPSRTSQPPPGMGPRPAPKPNFTASPKPAPVVPKVDLKKPKTKSKANLEAEAKAAFSSVAPDTSPEPLDRHLTADTAEQPIAEPTVPAMRRHSRPELGGNDPTIVGNVNDLMKQRQDSSDDERSADEWDASPTQNLTGDELGFPEFPMPKSTRDNKSGGNNGPSSDDGRKTSLQLPTPDFKSTVQSYNKPKAAPPASSPGGSSPRAGESHDPSITTTQAVRVVVWRDGNGVHVAPAGTVVSAITVDAVLVALDSNADLTAWLTQKGR